MSITEIKVVAQDAVPKPKASRACGECTACCQGWLTADINGHKMYPGRPCFYSCQKGCSIYDERPRDPCQTFECAWKSSPAFIPEWMRPDRIGAIAVTQSTNGVDYVSLIECGKKLDSAVLSWFFQQMMQGKLQNFRYTINGGVNFVGSKEFVEVMDSVSK